MTLETDNTNPVKTTKPRRWFRFRLRTLLVMVTLLSVPLGWIGWELDQRRKEKVVVAWIEEMGGNVFFDQPPQELSWWEKKKDIWFGKTVYTIRLPGSVEVDLSPLTDLKKLEWLDLTFAQVSDLTPLADLTKLKRINFSGASVSNLSPLSGLKNLEHLDLRHTNVSDLSSLAELKCLKTLLLINTQVRDLTPLVKLKRLETLVLCNTQASDLSPLTDLKNLELLDVSDTPVSKEQVQELMQALPDCEIIWSAKE